MVRQARYELIHRVRLFKNGRPWNEQCLHFICHGQPCRVHHLKAGLQFNGSFRQFQTGLRVPVQNDVNEKGVNGFRSSENGESLVSGGC